MENTVRAYPEDKKLAQLPKEIDRASKKILLLGIYLFFLPIFIVILVAYQILLINQSSQGYTGVLGATDLKPEFKALPENTVVLATTLSPIEARVEALQQFFKKYNSPLEPFAENIIQTADKYSIDYKLLPAIAMQESTLCKKAPANSYNCWGFGIYGGKVLKFANYSEAIETVTKTLAREYIGKGLIQPEEIMLKYSPQNHNDWAGKVELVMQEIESAI